MTIGKAIRHMLGCRRIIVLGHSYYGNMTVSHAPLFLM